MLIEELIAMKNEIYIALPDGEMIDDLKMLGCHFINTPMERRGMNPFQELKLYLLYKKIMCKIQPDYVITYTIKPNIYGGMAAQHLSIPYAMNITGLGSMFNKNNPVKKLIVLLYRMACKKVKVVFFENEGNRQVFVREKIVSLDRTHRLYGAGVDVNEYKFEEYPKDDNVVRYLYLGRVMKEKGIEQTIKAFQRLKNEKNVILDVVGPCDKQCEDMIQRLHNDNIINYYGFQKDVKPFIKKSHCLVFPSNYMEGMANVLLECGCMGRPIITTDNYGCREAVNGKNGFIVHKKDADDLYEKMKQFANMNYDEKKLMGWESHLYVKEHFAKDKVVKETIETIYKS